MISSSYDINEFVEGVRGKDYAQVIALAENEALEVWRASYQRRREADAEEDESRRYETVLKEFVHYLKSGISFPKKRQGFPENLHALHKELQADQPEDY